MPTNKTLPEASVADWLDRNLMSALRLGGPLSSFDVPNENDILQLKAQRMMEQRAIEEAQRKGESLFRPSRFSSPPDTPSTPGRPPSGPVSLADLVGTRTPAERPSSSPASPRSALPFQSGEMSVGNPEDFNPLTQGVVSTPPAGTAASVEPPAAPGRIVRGPDGKVILSNLADAGKPLKTDPVVAELKAKVAASGPMRFTSDTGQVVTLNPGGEGGYYYGGDLPDLSMTYEQMMAKDYNPGQQQLWVDEKNKAFEQAMKAAAVAKLQAEAHGLGKQGDLFGAQTGQIQEVTEGLKQKREMTPEESAYRGSSIPLEQWVMQNEDKVAVTLTPMVESAYLGLLADPQNLKLAKDPAFRLQLRQKAKAAAIRQYVQENQQALMKALMGSGVYTPPTNG